MDDRQRFAEVVLPHLDDALSLARWLTGNRTDAEDVVQEACIRAFGAIRSVRKTSARAWLLAIVRNTSFTWLAKNRPKSIVATGDDVGEEADAAGSIDLSTPEAHLIAKADAGKIHEAVASLPLAFREVLVLRELEEMSYKEISQVLSIPAGTVMSRLARARALLMQRLGATGGKEVLE